jgi:hypothetical protein
MELQQRHVCVRKRDRVKRNEYEEHFKSLRPAASSLFKAQEYKAQEALLPMSKVCLPVSTCPQSTSYEAVVILFANPIII